MSSRIINRLPDLFPEKSASIAAAPQHFRNAGDSWQPSVAEIEHRG
jgi:hypothetical protein